MAVQDELKAPVVVVKSIGTDGFEEIGTGILVGQQGDNLFILTVKHVLTNPERMMIRFFGTFGYVPAEVIETSVRWDMAVLQCKRPSNFTMLSYFKLSSQRPTFKEEVMVIGHPVGDYWFFNIENAVNELKHDSDNRLFTITPRGITNGNSGGPILNEQNELLGIVQKTNNRRAVGVSAGAIYQILTDWRIPINLIFANYKDRIIGHMVFVEGGTFTMGSNNGGDDEKPPHPVNVPSFYIGRYEITQAQWKDVMDGQNLSSNKCDACPVENVSWNDVQGFIKQLNRHSKFVYRLPTEAEWEYAAGGGQSNRTTDG